MATTTTTLAVIEGERSSAFSGVPKNIVKAVFTLLGPYKSVEAGTTSPKSGETHRGVQSTFGAKNNNALDPRKREMARRKLAHGVGVAQSKGYDVSQSADGRITIGGQQVVSTQVGNTKRITLGATGSRIGSFRMLDGDVSALPTKARLILMTIISEASGFQVELSDDEQLALLTAPQLERKPRQSTFLSRAELEKKLNRAPVVARELDVQLSADTDEPENKHVALTDLDEASADSWSQTEVDEQPNYDAQPFVGGDVRPKVERKPVPKVIKVKPSAKLAASLEPVAVNSDIEAKKADLLSKLTTEAKPAIIKPNRVNSKFEAVLQKSGVVWNSVLNRYEAPGDADDVPRLVRVLPKPRLIMIGAQKGQGVDLLDEHEGYSLSE